MRVEPLHRCLPLLGGHIGERNTIDSIVSTQTPCSSAERVCACSLVRSETIVPSLLGAAPCYDPRRSYALDTVSLVTSICLTRRVCSDPHSSASLGRPLLSMQAWIAASRPKRLRLLKQA